MKNDDKLSTEEFDAIWRDLYSDVDINVLASEYEATILTLINEYLQSRPKEVIKRELPKKLAEIGQDYLIKGLPSGTIMPINEQVTKKAFKKERGTNE